MGAGASAVQVAPADDRAILRNTAQQKFHSEVVPSKQTQTLSATTTKADSATKSESLKKESSAKTKPGSLKGKSGSIRKRGSIRKAASIRRAGSVASASADSETSNKPKAVNRWLGAFKTITTALSTDKHALAYTEYDFNRTFPALSEKRPDAIQDDTREARNVMLDGVDHGIMAAGPNNIVSPPICRLITTMPLSFPLICDGKDYPVVAASQHGNGRVVVFGHTGFIANDVIHYPEDNDHNLTGTRRLLQNVIRWAAHQHADHRITACCETTGTTRKFQAYGCECIAGVTADAAAGHVDLLVLEATTMTAETMAAARKHLEKGRGLIVAGSGIEWHYKRSSDSRCMPANQLLAEYGIAFTGSNASAALEYNDITMLQNPLFKPAKTRLLKACVVGSLQLVMKNATSDDDARALSATSKRAYEHVCLAVESLPQPSLLSKLVSPDVALEPIKLPVALADYMSRTKFLLQYIGMWNLPTRPGVTTVLPESAAAFGAGTPILINTWMRGLHSTGLYALPGEPVTITMSGSCSHGIACTIGNAIDKLWNQSELSAKEWTRHPEEATYTSLTEKKEETITIANHSGGLVYIESSGSILQTRVGAPKVHENLDIFAQAVLHNCIPAPVYRAGKTTDEEWMQLLQCDSRVLHGELVGKRITLTLPIDVVMSIEDPSGVVEFWDAVIDHLEDLTFRPEIDSFNIIRLLTDKQGGVQTLKHDPYAMSISEEDAAVIVKISELSTTNFKTFWRVLTLVTELFESALWPRFASGQCWKNTLSLYVCNYFLGMKLEPLVQNELEIESRATDFMMPSSRKRALLVGDHDTALCVLLIRTFGWKGIRKIFAQYARLEKWKSPKVFRERVDVFVCIVSQMATRDMRPFFELWNLHSSSPATMKQHLLEVYFDLPKWIPLFDVDPSTQDSDVPPETVRQWRNERENARELALEKAKIVFAKEKMQKR
eukprot:gene4071-14287_t